LRGCTGLTFFRVRSLHIYLINSIALNESEKMTATKHDADWLPACAGAQGQSAADNPGAARDEQQDQN
jgi:hypothetical protein